MFKVNNIDTITTPMERYYYIKKSYFFEPHTNEKKKDVL